MYLLRDKSLLLTLKYACVFQRSPATEGAFICLSLYTDKY